ncbi:hypothetical protein IRZ70_21975 [Pseudomonas monteilii]|nr:hypothetical protein [Pseudomonas monteilii]
MLEAALHNFHDDVEPGRLSRLQRSRTDPFPVTGLTLKTFIAYSRALDLGQRYQEHLQSVYQGAEHEQLKALACQAYQSLRDQQQETEKGLLLSLTQRVQQQAA